MASIANIARSSRARIGINLLARAAMAPKSKGRNYDNCVTPPRPALQRIPLPTCNSKMIVVAGPGSRAAEGHRPRIFSLFYAWSGVSRARKTATLWPNSQMNFWFTELSQKVLIGTRHAVSCAPKRAAIALLDIHEPEVSNFGSKTQVARRARA